MPDRACASIDTVLAVTRFMPGIRIWPSIIAVLLFQVAATAQFVIAVDLRPENSLSLRLAGDVADGRLDQFSLLEAALIAGGVSTSEQVADAVQQFDQELHASVRSIPNQLSGSDRVDLAFECLHKCFLRGEYRADYSELHRTLADGHFNCVTSTILFRCLCQRLHIESEIVSSPGHVLCRVPGVSGHYIETTCPECHSPEDDQQSPLKNAVELAGLRVISDVELLGKVYYNRGVAGLEAKQYSQAVDLFAHAQQFDREDRAARDNLLAALNNWALAECDDGRYETASSLIARGFAIDSSHAPLQVNDLHVHQQWVKSLCDRQLFSQAVEVLEAVFRRRPEATPFRDGRLAVYGLWAESLFARGEFPAGWRKLERGKQLYGMDQAVPGSLANIELAAVLTASERLIQSKRLALAHELIDQALARQRSNPDLLKRKGNLPKADL